MAARQGQGSRGLGGAALVLRRRPDSDQGQWSSRAVGRRSYLGSDAAQLVRSTPSRRPLTFHFATEGRRLSIRVTAVVSIGSALACGATKSRATSTPAPRLPVGIEAISFLGDTLRRLPLSAAVRTRYAQQLKQSADALELDPTDAESIIWYGRRLAYVGQFRDAIDVFSNGIARYPDNAWLYRHRGHRYLTVREIDRAISDLERAAHLAAGKPDEVEPDGDSRTLATSRSAPSSRTSTTTWDSATISRATTIARSRCIAATSRRRGTMTGACPRRTGCT